MRKSKLPEQSFSKVVSLLISLAWKVCKITSAGCEMKSVFIGLGFFPLIFLKLFPFMGAVILE